MYVYRTKFGALLLSAALVAALPAWAQEEAAAEETIEPKTISLEMQTWIAQPAGLDYTPATELDPDNPFGTQLLQPSYGTETEMRYRVGFRLPEDWGEIVVHYYTHDEENVLDRSNPSQFIYGETLVHPLFAGVFNDGLADGFTSTALTDLSDIRLDYYRDAFRAPKATGRWFVGWRRVSHQRHLQATYYALAPNLPPLIPPISQPIPNLAPFADFAVMDSDFEGRGPSGGLEVDFPMWKDKVVLETDVALTVLRGKIDTDYRSQTYLYELNGEILLPPYDEFSQFEVDSSGNIIPLANSISQLAYQTGLRGQSSSTSASVFEVAIGFRWKILPWLDASGGFRSARYNDVGVDMRPKGVTVVGGVNTQDVTEVRRSAVYDGFYFGVTFYVF